MSFLSHFLQAKTPKKPWKCRNCFKLFTLKAHAANHKRQSVNLSCRRKGFAHIEMQASSSNLVEYVKCEREFRGEIKVMELPEVDGESKSQIERDLELSEEQVEDVLLIGNDVDALEVKAKRERQSRKGCMKATPLKIARCPSRMTEFKQQIRR